MTGTAAQVTAITQVDHRDIGSGEMGPHTTRLRQLYSDAVRGRLDEYSEWVAPAYVEEPETVG